MRYQPLLGLGAKVLVLRDRIAAKGQVLLVNGVDVARPRFGLFPVVVGRDRADPGDPAEFAGRLDRRLEVLAADALQHRVHSVWRGLCEQFGHRSVVVVEGRVEAERLGDVLDLCRAAHAADNPARAQ